MTIRMRLMVVFCALALASTMSFGQDKNHDEARTKIAEANPNDGRAYQFVFVAQEVEGGKVINARRYMTDVMLMDQGARGTGGSFRSGSRVPYTSNGNDFSYLDLGFNVDFTYVKLEGNRMQMDITAELNSADTPAQAQESQTKHAVFRQNRWKSLVTVTVGKPTVIFSSDEMDSKRTMQVELTVNEVR